MTKQETDSLLASFRHLSAFLRDFSPEQNLQLLFPFASFVLFVGASSRGSRPGTSCRTRNFNTRMERFGLTSPRDSSCFGMTRSSARLVLASSVVSPCGAYQWEGPGRNLLSGFCSRAGSPSRLSWRSFSCTRRSGRRSWSQLITHSGQPCSHSRIVCYTLVSAST